MRAGAKLRDARGCGSLTLHQPTHPLTHHTTTAAKGGEDQRGLLL